MKMILSQIIKVLSPVFPYVKRTLYRFHGGVFPNYRKELSTRHPLHDPILPEELILPLQQHVGHHAKPSVKPGDRVLKNQLIAEPPKGLGAPIHAPTSGTVKALEDRILPHPSGLAEPCIVITPDGKDETISNALQTNGDWPQDPTELKSIVHQAGIVGMGGAGFPTYAKIPAEKDRIHTLLINGAECEPYITCDDLLMQTQAQDIIDGALIVASALGSQKIICGIEDNKQKALKAMRQAAQGTNVEIQAVPTVYPMGGQKQLTLELTGVEVPAHTHAVDIGILMMNVATFAAIKDAVVNGNPLTSRLVTVTGEGVNDAFNIRTLLGTPFDALVDLAKPKQPIDFPLIMGGPMMGFEVQDNHVPVIKTTNCILTNKPYIPEMVLPCIRCGECMDACPVNLLPQQLYWYSRSEEWDKAEQHHLFDCIECGCCSYVCPSNIPLVQYYRHAKSEIKLEKEAKQFAEHAKKRYEERLARIEREKQAREARLKAKKEAVKKQAAEKEKLDKKKPQQTPNNAKIPSPANEAGLSAREKAILAAKKRAAAAQSQPESDQPKTKQPSDSADKKRAAAMAAAKARAAAAKRKNADTPGNNDKTEQTTPTKTKTDAPEDKRAKAMAAAKARAEAARHKKEAEASKLTAAQTDEATSSSDKMNASETNIEDKRAKAMAAAKARAEAARSKKEAEARTQASQQTGEAAPSNKNERTSETSKEDKRAKAMAAAKARAEALRSKKQSQIDENNAKPSSTENT